jgi:hypothetical protein
MTRWNIYVYAGLPRVDAMPTWEYADAGIDA